ncbi:zincin [Pilatotrama ljubarskyi]|nr:zincin [Pilatotrama ljubarskyi]
MYKTLLVLFWAGRLVDHELASSLGYNIELVRSVALIIAAAFSTLVPANLHLPDRNVEPIPAHALSLASGPQAAIRLPGRPATANCTAFEILEIQDSVELASEYVSNALAELRTSGPEGDSYRRWFGAPNKVRFSTVHSNFDALGRDDCHEYTFVCNHIECAEYVAEYAFVDYTIKRVINLCPGFFTAPDHGRNSRASTIVHESTHFYRNGFTSDYSRNPWEAERLARSFPHLAVSNAESYEFFAADAPRRHNVPEVPTS